MMKRTTKLAGLAVVGFSIAVLLSVPLLAKDEHKGHGMHSEDSAATAPAKHHSMQEKHMLMQGMCVKKLDQVIKTIDAAIKAVERGHKATALAELKKAREGIAACRKTMSEMGQGKMINARCPIMGTKLDAKNVPQNLTRMYMGKKVGFCCGGCPGQWDKLSVEEKAKKLGAATPSAKTTDGCCRL